MRQYSYSAGGSTPPDKDPELWSIAQKRASFKYHVATYIIVNAFFWVLWVFSNGHGVEDGGPWPWPVWPMIGWGIGLAFHFLGAYVYPKSTMTEREYEKLKRNQNK